MLVWLLLTALSGGGLVVYALHQQYEDRSAEFRILYRDITVRLTQNDVILSLLSNSSDPADVQQKFPYILRWQTQAHRPPKPDLNPDRPGTYWLNSPQGSLLIDLPALLADVIRNQPFRHLSLRWQDKQLISLGEKGTSDWCAGISRSTVRLSHCIWRSLIILTGGTCPGCWQFCWALPGLR